MRGARSPVTEKPSVIVPLVEPLLLLAFASPLPPPALPPPNAAQDDAAPPRVLIVSPEPDGLAREFEELLGEHDVPATVATWAQASAERARGFDLVIVTGKGRSIERSGVVLDYDRPVLGIGPYGCKYFGLMQLKNGHPHT